MKQVDWYFDFISPFSYLQLERFDLLPRDVDVVLRPILFAGLLKHWQHKGPAEIPAKRRFTYRFVQWQADSQGIPLRFPPAHPFNPIKALRLAIALGCSREAVVKIFRFIWREGRALDQPSEWQALTDSLGVSDAQALIEAPAVKDTLRANGERAIAAGLFGVPSFVIDGEIFWGCDATAMAIDYLRDPARFSRGELARAVDLPVGVERPRNQGQG
jgi:2-hydroxychromene-2-carboxylate isomerase